MKTPAPSRSREQIALAVLLFFSAALSLSAQPGSLDPAFYRQAAPDDTVFAVAVQPDGKVLAGGTFTKVSGVPRNGIARLNPNASLDAVLTPSLLPDGRFQVMVQATPGQRVEVQASTDLITWATIAVITLESSTAQFIDDSALNFSWRFYRSTTLP